MSTVAAERIRVEEGQSPKILFSRGLYRGLCLLCGGAVEDSLLLIGIPLCRDCVRKVVGGDRLLKLVDEYESKLFLREWLKSLKSVFERFIVEGSKSEVENALEALRQVVGARSRSWSDIDRVLNKKISKLNEEIATLGQRLVEEAKRVLDQIWGLTLPEAEARGGKLRELIEIKRVVEGFTKFFQVCVGNEPWSIQRTWMYRVVQSQSFAMIAPTGVGKTTFGIVSAIYLALLYNLWKRRSFRTYIVVPTRVLVAQYYERARSFVEKLKERAEEVASIFREMGLEVDAERVREILDQLMIVALPPPNRVSRRRLEKQILEGSFDILITTSAYIHSKFNRVLKGKSSPLNFPFLWALKGVDEAFQKLCKDFESGALELPKNALVDEEFMDSLCRSSRGFSSLRLDYVFVDDVDAIMKGSKLIDYVFQLIGFDMGMRLEYSDGELRVAVVEGNALARLRQLIENVYESLNRELASIWRRIREADRKSLAELREFATERASRRINEALKRVEEIIAEASDRELADIAEFLRTRAVRAVERRSIYDFARTMLIAYASRVVDRELRSRRARCGMVIVSSATGRARGRRIRFFRYLLGFDIGGRLELYRKIVDAYTYPRRDKPFEEAAIEKLIEIVKRVGIDGGLVFVPVDLGAEYAELVASKLREHGIEAEAVTAKKGATQIIEEFRQGKYKILVGVAIYYGLIVRGLDLPERVRYAVFLGVPRHKINISRVEYSPTTLLRILGVLADVVPQEERERIQNYMNSLRRVLRRLSAGALKELVEKVSQGVVETKYAELVREVHDYVQQLLSRREIVDALRRSPTISVIEEEGTLYMLVPDAPTYIQASGRTSRLFAGGITQGLSIIVVDDDRLLHGLERRMRIYIDDFSLKSLEELEKSGELDKIIEAIDEDRKLVREVMASAKRVASKLKLVETVLIVVESPNKARTIARFFGRPSYRDLGPLRAYEVDLGSLHIVITASGGHVYDVVEYDRAQQGLEVFSDEIEIYGVRLRDRGSAAGESVGLPSFLPVYGAMKRCLVCGRQFIAYDVCPRCRNGIGVELNIRVRDKRRYEQVKTEVREIRIRLSDEVLKSLTKSSGEIVDVLKRLAMEVDRVVIGTDPDAEGEKIGFDLAITLAPFAKRIERMEFHEVTRKAIMKAIEELRGIDLNMVEAQIARRVEDRWVGFALSDYLRMEFESIGIELKTLSAGRVQTPTLGFVVRRHYLHDKTTDHYVRLAIEIGGTTQYIYVVRDIVQHAAPDYAKREALGLVLEKVSEEAVEIPPPPPFTTDELLTEASTVLGMSVDRAMAIAQQLFELGLITYHRTDSTRVSDTGIAIARQYLESAGLAELFQPRTWARGPIGAHECIRPTRPIDASKLRELVAEGVIELPVRLTEDHYRLYDLIFRRFMASQMKGVAKAKKVVLRVRRIESYEIERESVRVTTVVGKEFEKPLVTRIELYVIPEEVQKSSFLAMYVPPYMANRVVSTEIPSTLEIEGRIVKPKGKRLSKAISLCVRLPSQGDIVRWMKDQGVGRPSTYAKIVATLIDRRYIVARNNVVLANDRGKLVYSMLTGAILPPDIGESIEEVEEPQLRTDIRRRLMEVLLGASPSDKVATKDLKIGERSIKLVVALDPALAKSVEGIDAMKIIREETTRDIYELVSVRATARLVGAMEDIEKGNRFYHTVLECVLAEIWKLFRYVFTSIESEAIAQGEGKYARFVKAIDESRFSTYFKLLEAAAPALTMWLKPLESRG